MLLGVAVALAVEPGLGWPTSMGAQGLPLFVDWPALGLVIVALSRGRRRGRGRHVAGPPGEAGRRAAHRGQLTLMDGRMAGDGALIVCDNLVKIYKVADLEVVALQGLDLLVEPGEFIALVGASGSGKSTLMNILGGLDVPSAGRAVVAGHDLGEMGRRERTELPAPGDRLRLAADGAQPAART